ncbi:MAG TPA: amidohydrolase family protein [Thermoanaerobaculia bacterium]|jgi:imidazolonepropionase-like amidohydrolase|nr:amidohydrolase family protein [Thermoanaerobaculia bacterium]
MKRWFALFSLFAVTCATQRATVTEVRSSFLLAGKTAGYQSVSTDSSGALHTHFEYNDRGRGPKLDTVMRLGARGIPVKVDTAGNDYVKAAVEEHFDWSNTVARWKNSAEEGEKQVAAGEAFYSSMYGPPEETFILARALLHTPDARLPLLPAGEVRIAKLGNLTVKQKELTLYELSGFDLTPSYLWLDRNLDSFASVGSWSSTIREGWEDVAPQLLEEQQKFAREHFAKLGRELTRIPPGPVVIRNVTLFDSESARTIPAQTVVITGNRITQVGSDIRAAEGGGAPLIIDGTGKTLLPGLWDMHVHLSESDGPLDIAAGVTSVRDLANDIDAVLDLKKQWDSGTAIGPRVILAGIIDGPGPFAGPTKVIVDTEAEAKAAIDRYKSLGYEQIKIYNSVRKELVPFIVNYSHQLGLRVSGHVPAFLRAEEVVRLGYDEIQHTYFLFLNFYRDVTDTRGPTRFITVAQRGADLDLDSEEVRSFIALLKEKGTVIDPTVSVIEELFTARKGTTSPVYEAIAHRLPPQVRRGTITGGLPVPEGMDAKYRQSFRKVLQMVKALYDAGIPIVAGTDAFAGFALHRELENYVAAGIPAPKVLQLATLGAARIMKRDRELGSVAPGKLADVILVDGNPAERISDIRRVSLTIKDGRLYTPGDVYAALNILP